MFLYNSSTRSQVSQDLLGCIFFWVPRKRYEYNVSACKVFIGQTILSDRYLCAHNLSFISVCYFCPVTKLYWSLCANWKLSFASVWHVHQKSVTFTSSIAAIWINHPFIFCQTNWTYNICQNNSKKNKLRRGLSLAVQDRWWIWGGASQ